MVWKEGKASLKKKDDGDHDRMEEKQTVTAVRSKKNQDKM